MNVPLVHIPQGGFDRNFQWQEDICSSLNFLYVTFSSVFFALMFLCNQIPQICIFIFPPPSQKKALKSFLFHFSKKIIIALFLQNKCFEWNTYINIQYKMHYIYTYIYVYVYIIFIYLIPFLHYICKYIFCLYTMIF